MYVYIYVCVCEKGRMNEEVRKEEQSHVKLVAIGVLQTRGACHLGADHGDTHGRGRRRGQQARLHPCKWCTARTVLPKMKKKRKKREKNACASSARLVNCSFASWSIIFGRRTTTQ